MPPAVVQDEHVGLPHLQPKGGPYTQDLEQDLDSIGLPGSSLGNRDDHAIAWNLKDRGTLLLEKLGEEEYLRSDQLVALTKPTLEGEVDEYLT
jgi:hypothetical protein